jgi:hypothetical protein
MTLLARSKTADSNDLNETADKVVNQTFMCSIDFCSGLACASKLPLF